MKHTYLSVGFLTLTQLFQMYAAERIFERPVEPVHSEVIDSTTVLAKKGAIAAQFESQNVATEGQAPTFQGKITGVVIQRVTDIPVIVDNISKGLRNPDGSVATPLTLSEYSLLVNGFTMVKAGNPDGLNYVNSTLKQIKDARPGIKITQEDIVNALHQVEAQPAKFHERVGSVFKSSMGGLSNAVSGKKVQVSDGSNLTPITFTPGVHEQLRAAAIPAAEGPVSDGSTDSGFQEERVATPRETSDYSSSVRSPSSSSSRSSMPSSSRAAQDKLMVEIYQLSKKVMALLLEQPNFEFDHMQLQDFAGAFHTLGFDGTKMPTEAEIEAACTAIVDKYKSGPEYEQAIEAEKTLYEMFNDIADALRYGPSEDYIFDQKLRKKYGYSLYEISDAFACFNLHFDGYNSIPSKDQLDAMRTQSLIDFRNVPSGVMETEDAYKLISDMIKITPPRAPRPPKASQARRESPARSEARLEQQAQARLNPSQVQMDRVESDPELRSYAKVVDAYAVLKIEPGANEEAIEAAYKALSKQFHPDRKTGNKEAFQKVSSSHDILKKYMGY